VDHSKLNPTLVFDGPMTRTVHRHFYCIC